MPFAPRRLPCASLAAAALLLTACAGAPPAALPHDGSARAPATTTPAPSVEAGALSSLAPHLGRYPHQGYDYLRQGPLAERLRTLLGAQDYAALLANLQVSGPLQQEGGVWFITGNRPHEGGSEQAAVAIDPAADALRVWLRHAGETQDLADPRSRRVPWPTDVRTLLRNAQEP